MPDNPAWRLSVILERMVKHKSHPRTPTTREAILTGVGSFSFSVSYKDILYHVFEIQRLMHEVVEWIEDRDLDDDLFKEPVERLWGGVMGIDPEAKWDLVKDKINPADVRSLMYLSHEFEKEAKRNAKHVSDDEMAALVAEVDALYDAVKASDMPEDVKSFILEQLAAIRHAIRVYPYKGYKSLEQVLQQNIGATMLFSSRLNEVAHLYPEEISKWKKVMGHLSTLLTKAAEVATIAEPLKPIIKQILGIEDK